MSWNIYHVNKTNVESWQTGMTPGKFLFHWHGKHLRATSILGIFSASIFFWLLRTSWPEPFVFFLLLPTTSQEWWPVDAISAWCESGAEAEMMTLPPTSYLPGALLYKNLEVGSNIDYFTSHISFTVILIGREIV